MFREGLNDGVSLPAYKDTFTTYNGISTKLDKEQCDFFHKVTAKLLFIAKRGRLDLETALKE
eukprot:6390854-Ditylum_brightwellii.AAC.1